MSATSCREIAAGNSLDVLEIDAASNRGIDQVRELRDMVRYAPAGGRYKVIILDEAHMLTSEASNALLKTLEEPPDKVIFVMATTAARGSGRYHSLPLAAFSFPRALLHRNLRGARIGHAEGKSCGRAGRAGCIGARRRRQFARRPVAARAGPRVLRRKDHRSAGARTARARQRRGARLNWWPRSKPVPPSACWLWCTSCSREGQNLQQFCREAIGHFRNLLVARVCGADSDLVAAPPDERPGLARAAAAFSEEDLTRCFQILLQTDDDMRRKPDPRLHLEMGLLRLVNAARLAPLEEVLAELSGNSRAPPEAAGGRPARDLSHFKPKRAAPAVAPQAPCAAQPPAPQSLRSARGRRAPPRRRRRHPAAPPLAESCAGQRQSRCRLTRSAEPLDGTGRRASVRRSNRRSSRSKNFSPNWSNMPAVGNSTAAKSDCTSPPRPRSRRTPAGSRVPGEIAHNRKPRIGPAAARLC